MRLRSGDLASCEERPPTEYLASAVLGQGGSGRSSDLYFSRSSAADPPKLPSDGILRQAKNQGRLLAEVAAQQSLMERHLWRVHPITAASAFGRIHIYLFGSVTPSTRKMRGTRAIDEPWGSIKAVVAHLGVGKDTIYPCIDTQGLPAQQVGGLFRFGHSQVDEWIQESIEDKPTHRSSSTAAKNARIDQENG